MLSCDTPDFRYTLLHFFIGLSPNIFHPLEQPILHHLHGRPQLVEAVRSSCWQKLTFPEFFRVGLGAKLDTIQRRQALCSRLSTLRMAGEKLFWWWASGGGRRSASARGSFNYLSACPNGIWWPGQGLFSLRYPPFSSLYYACGFHVCSIYLEIP
jgi:hypothetical protein